MMPEKQLVECGKVWRLIYLAGESFRDDASKLIVAKEIKRRLDWLEMMKGLQETVALSSSSPLQIDPMMFRELDSQLEKEFKAFLVRNGRMQAPAPQPIPDMAITSQSGIDEKVERRRLDLAKLAMSRSRCLAFVDGEIFGAPVDGITGCRARPGARDLVALATDVCISDLIIDAYLCLVCHFGNRHLPTAAAQGERPVTPKWHAWSTEIGRSLVEKGAIVGTRDNWPPALYPKARLGDVMHHVFSILFDENHWVMAVLHREDSRPRLEFFSSIKNQRFKRDFMKLWSPIKAWMLANGQTNTGLRDLICVELQQPEQRNVVDCGVFILCEARWMMEERPLSTLLPENIRQLRRQMAVELELWKLL